MKTLILGEAQIKRILTMKDTLTAVEECFAAFGRGEVVIPPKMYLTYPKYNGDIRVMPSWVDKMGISGVKIVNVHPDNPRKFELRSVMAVLVMIEPKNGFPIAIFDATHITLMRTGAAAGVASKYLARTDAKVLGLVGTGKQAWTQLEAIVMIRPISQVLLYDIDQAVAEAFREEFAPKYPRVEFEICKTLRSCVERSDIVCTLTPVRKPIVKADWVRPGTHINAMGADAEGKEELEPALLKRAKVIIDDFAQTTHSGEINVPWKKGLITKKDIWSEIGKVVAGLKPGRTSDKDITIFDSTGLGVQDLVTAAKVYKIAKAKGLGKEFALIG
ncbi:MAG: alanine dehydrogenase [candidate division WOR-3 bacterium]